MMFSALTVAIAITATTASAAPVSLPARTTSALALRSGGFGKPTKSALALRGGGVTNDQLSNTLAGVLIASGLQGWYAPKEQMKMYAPAVKLSDEEVFFLRALQGLNVVQGLTMMAAAESGLSAATIVCLFGQAMSTTANIGLLEKLEVKTGPIVGCIALFGTLGELARRGVITSDLASNINNIMLLASVGEILKPEPIIKAFLGKREPSALSKSLLQNFSWTKFNTGLFLLISKRTGKRGLGLAAATASNTVNVIATMRRSDEIGVKKAGLIFWAVVSGAFSLLALKNEKDQA